MPEFTKLGLGPALVKALKETGYTAPTPIQAQAIAPVLAGRDLLGIAQTGTGKTAAFALPILERLGASAKRPSPGRAKVLVLTPTRELAAQIEDSFKRYGKHLRLSTAVIFGGVGQGKQVEALRRGLDVLIATPGRLLDLMEQRHAHLDQVEVLVLDEADRMLDMGFIVPIRKITSKIPAKRQTLLFSATMPEAIAGLAASLLSDPVRVAITPQATTVERVEQKLMTVSASAKRQLLCHLLADDGIYQALVFTRTKHGADRVTEELGKHKIDAAAIHGNKSQGQRERALALFRSGALKVLVATDIAARGLDIPGVSHVINYELPDEPESYVHRIGRTARAGREGVAIALCSPDEREQLRDIEKIIGMRIPVDSSQPFHLEIAPMGQGGPSRPPNMRNRSGGGRGQGGGHGQPGRPSSYGQPRSSGPRPEAHRGPADANGERLSAPAGIGNRPDRSQHPARSHGQGPSHSSRSSR